MIYKTNKIENHENSNFARVSTNIQEHDRQVNELTVLANNKGWSVEAISLINNIDRFILDAPIALKIKLLGSMFPEKIEFDGKKYRTKNYNKVLDFIYQQTNELYESKTKSGDS